MQNIQGVIDAIYCRINENKKPTPGPSQEGKKRAEKSRKT